MGRLLLGVLLSPSLVLGLVPFTSAAEPAPSPTRTYGKVELLRDAWGVPHVFAESDAGALYGLGYAVAEDRAFQMYYGLRIIQGRLAELVGDRPSQRKNDTAVTHDRKMRTFGFYRAAKAVAGKLDADTLALLRAYCDGINDYVAGHRDQLHPLFARLDLQPEPWTPADCIVSWWHLGQYFATDGTNELTTYREIAKGNRAGPPANVPVDDAAAVVQKEDVSPDWLDRVKRFHREHGREPAAQADQQQDGPRFSHAWVVGGKKTTTGSAVLVSDPQTQVRNPSLWYEFHLSGKSFNARGLGVPGSPGMLIGWNEHVAWGATALGGDQADLFRLKTDAEHPNQYELDGRWRDMEVIRETILVKDAKPVELTVRQTVFGPVVTAFASPVAGDPEVALKRVPMCHTDRETIQALLGMMRAPNLDRFTQAIAGWHFPSLNLVFGDTKGNVGYWLQASIPVRSRNDVHEGIAAVDGSDSRNDWQGFVPHDLLPHVINPSKGWVASGNHRPIASFYPLSLGGPGKGNSGHTLRSWRLYERLAARDRFAPADVLDVHYDTVNPGRRDIVGMGLHLRDTLKRTLSADATAALGHLEAWHRRGAKSDLTEAGAALVGEIETEFRIRHTPLVNTFGGGAAGLTRFCNNVRARLDKDPRAELSATEQDYIDRTLAAAWKAAQKRYGAVPAQWQEKARAQVLQRPLGYFDSLDGFGSLDPSGDLMTPALTCVDGDTIKSQAGQSYTQYIPLHDLDSARSLLPPGQSEKADSPFRTVTRDLWAKGELHPAPLSRKAVEKIARTRTVLAN